MFRKLVKAIAMEAEYEDAFIQYTKAMSSSNVTLWTAQVVQWEKDKTRFNPYQSKRSDG